ncbi:MAG: hypothetical protein LQ350_008133 [Teloschistes chrysophthalmus]|nr:MAG: hypothetical protein LQ350_008133 [Niorma chrysophthalma]
MLPKPVIRLGKLLKLPSGKVYRKKLKHWVGKMSAAAGDQVDLVPTTTEQEIALEKFWADIFEREPANLGATVNFFSLGGGSVSAIKLVSACRAVGYTLSVGVVFKYPVLRELATNLKRTNPGATAQTGKPFEIPPSLKEQILIHGLYMTDDLDYVYPAAPGQVEFLNQGQRRDQYWVLMAVRPLAESTDINKWIEITRELIRLNPILRTTFCKCPDMGKEGGTEDEWIGVVLKCTNANLSICDCRSYSERTLTIEKIWRKRFSFGEPWVQYALLNTPDGTPSAQTKAPKATAQVSLLASASLYTLVTNHNVTPSIVFQTAFQLFLMREAGCRDVCFDYLLSGRNIDLPNPQHINGNLANFLPFRSILPSATSPPSPCNDTEGDEAKGTAHQDDNGSGHSTMSLVAYLKTTQAQFWRNTEHGMLSLDAIYTAAGLSRASYGNRALFLFQPFDPPAGTSPPQETLKYLVLEGSEVRMYQPYALVVEISRRAEGHLVMVMYDEDYFQAEGASRVGNEIVRTVESMIEMLGGKDGSIGVEEFLGGLDG